MVKYIVFDIGGVLVEVTPEKFYKKTGILLSVSPEQLREIRRQITLGKITPHQAFTRLISNNHTTLSLRQILESFIKDYIGRKISYMEDLINKLKKLSFKLCLLSNINEFHFNYIAKLYNNFPGFYKFYLSHELNLMKPDKRIFKYVLSDLKARPQEVLFIDDSKENINSAKELGIRTVYVTKNKPEKDKIISELRKLNSITLK